MFMGFWPRSILSRQKFNGIRSKQNPPSFLLCKQNFRRVKIGAKNYFRSYSEKLARFYLLYFLSPKFLPNFIKIPSKLKNVISFCAQNAQELLNSLKSPIVMLKSCFILGHSYLSKFQNHLKIGTPCPLANFLCVFLYDAIIWVCPFPILQK